MEIVLFSPVFEMQIPHSITEFLLNKYVYSLL